MTLPLQVFLISETPDIRGGDLYAMKAGLEIGARHFAEAWGLPPPAIDILAKRTALPPGCCPVVFLDREVDPGALAVHYWDPVRRVPAARVLVQRASGMNSGDQSVVESASHEINELLADPKIDEWRPMPGRIGIDVALEPCDPPQTHYMVQANGTDWRCANFVTPAWFDRALLPFEVRSRFMSTGGRFDHLGEFSSPGQIGPKGYALLRTRRMDGSWDVYAEMSNGAAPSLNVSKQHPWARTQVRLAR